MGEEKIERDDEPFIVVVVTNPIQEESFQCLKFQVGDLEKGVVETHQGETLEQILAVPLLWNLCIVEFINQAYPYDIEEVLLEPVALQVNLHLLHVFIHITPRFL